MFRFQIPSFISFGLGKYYHLRVVDFYWPDLLEDYISVISKSSVNANLLPFGQFLADGKLLAVSKHIVDSILFSFGKCLLDTKCLASIKVLQS